MKIGIYGGSFNPIHKGHINIAEHSIKELGLDKLIFVPAYKSPFKSKIKYAPVEDRINMINMSLPDKSEVSKFEANRKGVSYTIDTIRYFKQKYPNDELFLIIGSDNVYKLNKWKSIEEISQTAKIVVFKREGDFSKINIKKYNGMLLNNELYDYASSWFRKGYTSNVNEDVMQYISDNFLYVTDILVNMVDAKRHKHCIAVGSLAAQYAKVVGEDPKKAWFAGTFHDITKGQEKSWHREYLELKGIDELMVKDYQLHSLTGYLWVRDEYKMKDDKILNSIRVHTSLEMELSNFDKIIYAADKLAEGRKFSGIQELRKLIMEDFDKGFAQVVKVTYEHLVETRGEMEEKQRKVYEKWMEQ